MLKVIGLLLLFLLFLVLLTTAIQFLWTFLGVGTWTGLGEMPWKVALFVAIIPSLRMT